VRRGIPIPSDHAFAFSQSELERERVLLVYTRETWRMFHVTAYDRVEDERH
jgi:hypothetical protein